MSSANNTAGLVGKFGEASFTSISGGINSTTGRLPPARPNKFFRNRVPSVILEEEPEIEDGLAEESTFISGLSTTGTNYDNNDNTVIDNTPTSVDDTPTTSVDDNTPTSFDQTPSSVDNTLVASSWAKTPISKPSSKITVAVRARPVDDNHGRVVDIDQDQIIVALDKTFRFDTILDEGASQCRLYESLVRPAVDQFLNPGYNATIFAYGQTGTGKTFTMGTDPASCSLAADNRGVITRVLETIFTTSSFFSVKISFYEILNEQVYDLLNHSNHRVPLQVREDVANSRFYIPNITEEVANDVTAAVDLLRRGSALRKTEKTLLNDSSSRGHAVYTVILATADEKDRTVTRKLSLVDLAGSESVGRTQAVGPRLAEANSINKSLLSLGQVVTGICQRKNHIKYRDSTLTKVLKESLNGASCVTMIACISLDEKDTNETVSTLRFANKAKELTTRPVPAHLLASCTSNNRKRKLAESIPKTPATGLSWNNTIHTPTPSKLAKTQVGGARKLNLTIGTPGRWRGGDATPRTNTGRAGLVTSTVVQTSKRVARQEPTPADINEEEADISGVSMIEPPVTESRGGVSSQQAGDIDISQVMSPFMKKYTEKITGAIATTMMEQFSKMRSDFMEKEKHVSGRRKTRMTSSPNRLANRGRKTITETIDMEEDESLEKNPTLLVTRMEGGGGEEDEEDLFRDIISGHMDGLGPLPLCDVTNKRSLEEVSSASPRLSLRQKNTVAPVADIPTYDSPASTAPARRPLQDLAMPQSDLPEPQEKDVPGLEPREPEDAVPGSPTIEEMERTLGITNSPGGEFLFSVPTSRAQNKGEKQKRSVRRTTMLSHELNDTLQEIRNSKINRRQSIRLAAKDRPKRDGARDVYYGEEGPRDEQLQGRSEGEKQLRHPLEVNENWNVDPATQKRHNRNILGLLNTANMKMLQRLPAIGPKASLIIQQYRDLQGGIETLRELDTIGSLGKNFFKKFCTQNQIILDGEEEEELG